MKKWWRIILLAASLALFAWFIQRTDWTNIRYTFAKLGPLMFVALIPYAIVFTIDCVGWRFTFGPGALKGIPFHVVWSIRLIGEAINNVIPSMYVGGEAVKVGLLKRRGVAVVTAASAAVRSKTAQSVAQSTFVAIAALVAAVTLPPEMATAKYIFGSMAVAGFVIMTLLFKLQAHGMFMTMLGWVRSLGFRLKSMDAREESLRHMDEAISTFYTHSRRRFIRCTLTYLMGWMVDTLEILLVSHALGMPVEWHQALVIEAFIGVAKGFNTVVPGAFGVQEFSVMALFLMFGHPEALGMQYAIIRRGRDLAFTALGWGFLYNDEASLKGITQRVRKEADKMEALEDAGVNETLEDD